MISIHFTIYHFSILILIYQTLAENCENKENCNECIKELDCAWCISTDSNQTQYCFSQDKINANCIGGEIINPIINYTIFANEEIVTSSKSRKIVQIKPQRMRLSLRKGAEYTVDFTYGQSHDFPVDLYYILDLSASLKKDKARLAENGYELVSAMKRVTKDFAIGFGSFVDKTDAPFISTAPGKINKPCEGCVAAYSYKNHLSLVDDGDEFVKQVTESQVSGNLDVPEGGFDALMQAMVCSEVIGWRKNSTRIIVFSTDAPFHVAGDGKLAGIVIPNDGKCHMENNSYTAGLTYDYPSISHINHVAKTNNFHILFIVKDHVKALYKELTNVIDNSKVVGLEQNTEITKVIGKYYQDISTSVSMSTNTSEKIHVSFEVDCHGNGNFVKSHLCQNIVADQRINYRATIKALACFDKETIYIKPQTQDVALEVEVVGQCKCNCGEDIENATPCEGHGDLHCGVCECHKGFNGKHCECDQSKGEDYLKDTECKYGNDTDNCSGRGSCLCNVCQCEKLQNPAQKISGKYCECDNFSCRKQNGQYCSNNGECVCGKCECKPEWSGPACECKDGNSTCMFEDTLCNNHGHCECGKCKCDTHFFGQFCEECSTCFHGKCGELKPCVECKVYETGPYMEDCAIKCTKYTINVVDHIDENQDTEEVKTCVFVEDSCKMIFSYRYENEKIIVSALKELQCTQPINVLALVLGIIGGILLIGILLLIGWKVVTNYKDKVEYARFEEQKAREGWGGNPLFVSPVTKYRNPAYRRRNTNSYRSN